MTRDNECLLLLPIILSLPPLQEVSSSSHHTGIILKVSFLKVKLCIMPHGRRQVARLPAELIITIFFHCLPDNSYPSLHGDAAPLLLSHVCRSWRSLALAVSRLWSSFNVDFHNGYVTPRLEALEFWLKHSKEQPLFFDIIYEPPTHTTRRVFQGQSTAFVKALLRHSSRWRDVRFVTPGASCRSSLHGPITGIWLRSLEALTARYERNLALTWCGLALIRDSLEPALRAPRSPRLPG